MDKTDIDILLILLQDGRSSYEKIARKVKLTPNSVKNRIDKLVEIGIIKKFSTYLNPIMFNKSICFSLCTVQPGILQSDLAERIGKFKEVVAATISLENKVSIIHHFSNTNELHQTLEKIKLFPEILDMKNYILLLPVSSSKDVPKITKTDWRIIDALSENCRKTDTELAAELKLSAKTIKRRLSYLVNNAIINFMVSLDTSSGDFLTYELVLTLKKIDTEIISKIKSLIPDIFYIWRIVNAEVLIITVKIDHLRVIEEHIKKLKSLPEIVEIETYVPTNMYYFKGWGSELIQDQLQTEKVEVSDELDD